MPDPPSYSAVRAMLRILEEKGHLRHEQEGPRYVFVPTVSPERARQTALSPDRADLFRWFPGRSHGRVDRPRRGQELNADELERLAAMIEHARKEGR